MSKVIEINNLSKVYDLGLVGTGTLSKDLNRSWAKLRGKPDPYATLVELNDRTQKSSSNMIYALKDINFSVEQGEVLGIIGKNGAGKSTLLKILSQITSPSTGSIKMKGRVASLLEVGTGMHPEMTARQNIYLNGSLMGMRRHEITSKLDEIVDFAGIEKYIDTPTKRFSSGMTVRLGFAIAAFLDPEILIVDEVLAVGDVEFQKKAVGKMQDISNSEGRTVLFVSHNMASVKNLCTKGIILVNGEIIHSGTAEESVDYYLKKTMELSDIAVSERTDREGNGLVKFNAVNIENENGSRVRNIISGKSCKFIIDYINFSKEPLDKLFFGITIYDANEMITTIITTDELGVNLIINKEKGAIIIDIDNLLLRAGKYTMMLFLSHKENSGANNVVFDRITNVIEFVVEKGDFWETGCINRPVGYLQDATMYGN